MGTTVVIGAGVIGLSSAYELLKRGRAVIVVDSGTAGGACSAGNAGWVVPAMSAPIPAPGLVATSLRWMLKRDSPLYIRPRLDPTFAKWIWQFWRNCRSEPFHDGLAAVMALNRDRMRLFDAWRDEGLEFEMKQNGLLFAGLTDAAIDHAVSEMTLLSPFGYAAVTRLDGRAIRDLEPGLSDRVAGGFLLPDERTVRPEELTAALSAAVQKLGGTILTHTPATGARIVSGEVRAIQLDEDSIECDDVLIAAGAWSGDVGRLFGARLPIQAGKGYSITFSTDRPPVSRPVDLIESKVACTPFEGAFRLAGTMELSGQNLRLELSRVAAVRRAGSTYFGEFPSRGTGDAWVGMRPLTPDGLPIIGAMPRIANAYVATGHAMLGVTLAPATGRAIAALMCDEAADLSLRPFSVTRFDRGKQERAA